MKIIAETAWHHEGDFEFMNKLIDTLIKTEVNYIKVHVTLDLDDYMTSDHPAYNTLKKWMLTTDQWDKIIRKIKDNGKEVFLLLNDISAVDFAKQYNPSIIEVHSVALNDLHLLKKIEKEFPCNTKIVFGVGGSTLYEIENAVSCLPKHNIVLMHGFQNYPTKYEDINLQKIRKLVNLYPHFQHGYADHCAWNEPYNILITLFGASLGMDYIEKHVTLKHGEKRCDWNSAISINMLNELIDNLKILSVCEGNGQLALNQGEQDYSVFGNMKKAAILSRDVKKGELLELKDIKFKRTGQSTDLTQIDINNLVGSKYTHNFPKNYCLEKKDLMI